MHHQYGTHTHRSIDKLEAVQRHAARFVLTATTTSSVSRLTNSDGRLLNSEENHTPGIHLQNPPWTNPVSTSSTPELSTEVAHSYPGLLRTRTIFPVRQRQQQPTLVVNSHNSLTPCGPHGNGFWLCLWTVNS